MKLYIIAGEASGDLHGSELIKELFLFVPHLHIRCWGGEKMEMAGGQLVKHYKETAFMGFVEVLKNLTTIKKLFSFCKKDLLDFKPDALILIDYPGFNLRMAPFAKEHNIPVFYYISPQVWAWKANRVKKIKKFVDKLFVILPFEKDYFEKNWDYEVEYVGHPLLDFIKKDKEQFALREHIAFLPGSRKQEINTMLPLMLKVAKNYPEEQFIIAGVPTNGEAFYNSFSLPNNVALIMGDTYGVFKKSKAAVVTSGTATLEAALFNVPQVVVYKGNRLSYEIGKRLVKIDYISLVNLILDRPLITELIQMNATTDKVSKELNKLLNDSSKKQEIAQGYLVLTQLLGKGGAARKVAKTILQEVPIRSITG